MEAYERVTAVIVNFNTQYLLHSAYTSLRVFYPYIPIIIVDNGSIDGSSTWIRNLKDPNLTVLHLSSNIGHGPAMDKAIRHMPCEFAFTLDTDCTVVNGQFIERMVNTFDKDPQQYATGWLRHVDGNGVAVDVNTPGKTLAYFSYIHPCASMYRISMYNDLQPFEHHGAPCLRNMITAWAKGLYLVDFPIFDYIEHLAGGTRRMYPAPDWNPGDAKPGVWKRNVYVPI